MPEIGTSDQILNYTLGLTGEAGEFAEMIKKAVYHGHPITREKVKEELGDVLHYVAGLASHFDLALDEVAEYNINKLLERYPEGFSEEASRNRFIPTGPLKTS